MKIWTVLVLLGIMCLPAYARPIDTCAFDNNLLWRGLSLYDGPPGKMARIRDFMSNGWKPLDKHSLYFDNVLTTAVWFGYADIVEQQLGDRKVVSNYGAQSLDVAAAMGRLKIMFMLLNAGVSANAVFSYDGNYDTPIISAAQNGCVDAMQLLVANGANVNSKAQAGPTLLEDAVASRHFAAARFLLTHGYEVSRAERERVNKILLNAGIGANLVSVFWQYETKTGK